MSPNKLRLLAECLELEFMTSEGGGGYRRVYEAIPLQHHARTLPKPNALSVEPGHDVVSERIRDMG